MASEAISALPAAASTNVLATTIVPMTDTTGPTTFKMTLAQLRTGLFPGGAGYANDVIAAGSMTLSAGGNSLALQANSLTTWMSIDAPASPGFNCYIEFQQAGTGMYRVGRGAGDNTVSDFHIYNVSTGNIEFAQFQVGGCAVRSLTITNGHMLLAAATTSNPSLTIPPGTAPASPNNGDIWFDGTNLNCQVGGVTKVFTLT